MDEQRTRTIRIADDPDLRATLAGFQGIQQRISPACYHDGKPLAALALHRAVYADVKGARCAACCNGLGASSAIARAPSASKRRPT